MIDHIQIAIPANGEDRAREFFVQLLQMQEEEKPAVLAARGGCWFRSGQVHLHCGVESPFQPQSKAHPALIVDDLNDLASKLKQAGYPVRWDESLPDRKRFYTDDPFGNRIEFMQNGDGFSQKIIG